SCNLTGLWDSTDYSVAIRCINNESVFWSGWSGEKNGSTEEKAPSGKVDLWRVIESSHSSRNRSRLLTTSLTTFASHHKGFSDFYTLWCAFPPRDTSLFVCASSDLFCLCFARLDWFLTSVCAFQAFMKTELLIFSVKFSAYQVIETVMTSTTNEEVVVQWITSEPETTKYVVEWYEELEMDPFGRSWQYVSNSTEWKNNKRNFKPFICYNISVYPLYGSNVGAPSYAQIYTQERKPSEGPVADTDILGKNEVTIKWNEISKAKRNGFITNYTIFYKPEDGKELNETVNSDVLQYRLKSLQADTQYTVRIMASNKAGGTSGEQKTFKTLKF
ncbi:IL31R protein, partial [Cercotrichas coryphoeus]|nr:IL31R protein [Cercotrichas coryphoeus]